MKPSEFAALRASDDLEAACQFAFQEATEDLVHKGRSELSEGQLTVLCVETFFGETCNGGLYQYLTNQSAIASGCADALRRVGLPAYAEIMEQTLEKCSNSPEVNEFGELEDYFDLPDFESDEDFPLNELDDRFFELYSADESQFRRQLFQYIIDHEAEFVG